MGMERWLKEYPFGGDGEVSQIALSGSRRGTHCETSQYRFVGDVGLMTGQVTACGLLGNWYESLPVVEWGTGTSHCLWLSGERVRVTACGLVGNGYESLPVVYWGTGASHCL